MRKFWISIIWGASLIAVLVFLALVKMLTDGMFIAWVSAFGGVFVFFITGNVLGDHAIDGALNSLPKPPNP